MKYTIAELVLANELCFIADFERLLKKHLPQREQALVSHYTYEYKTKHKANLIEWIFKHSRADLELGMGQVIDGMLNDLLVGLRGCEREHVEAPPVKDCSYCGKPVNEGACYRNPFSDFHV